MIVGIFARHRQIQAALTSFIKFRVRVAKICSVFFSKKIQLQRLQMLQRVHLQLIVQINGVSVIKVAHDGLNSLQTLNAKIKKLKSLCLVTK